MNAEQFEHCGRHIECWDARDGVAWMVREASIEHERPLSRLAVLVHGIAEERGAAMLCCGTTSLHDRDSAGDVRVMEADQAIYLDGVGAQALRSPILVREGQAPDVVLEVDHTTDVRRRKLGVYEEWGVSEVWVEVPDAPARSRPRSRRSGLTIHVRDAKTKRYREAPASAALPGWTAAEIHLALNEDAISDRTWAALARVGQALRQLELRSSNTAQTAAVGTAATDDSPRTNGCSGHCGTHGSHGACDPRDARHRLRTELPRWRRYARSSRRRSSRGGGVDVRQRGGFPSEARRGLTNTHVNEGGVAYDEYCERRSLPRQYVRRPEMIISHKHKFIFIRPRKVAGTSVSIALGRSLDSSDVLIFPVAVLRPEAGLDGDDFPPLRRQNVDTLGSRSHGHMLPHEVKDKLEPAPGGGLGELLQVHHHPQSLGLVRVFAFPLGASSVGSNQSAGRAGHTAPPVVDPLSTRP